MNDSETKKIVKALLKKALGYSVEEVSEEYGVDEEGKLVLQKKKVTNKHIPADMTAVKVLLDEFFDEKKEDYSTYSDEQLEKEKTRLIGILKDMDAKILAES